jgi:hypothetical protein
VKSVRTTLSAIALLVAVIGTTTAPAFAGLAHPICAAKQHDCGKTPSIKSCCCGHAQTSPASSTPVQSRVEMRSDLTLMPAATSAVQVATTPHAPLAVHTSPPHRALLDLPTLFATLLL